MTPAVPATVYWLKKGVGTARYLSVRLELLGTYVCLLACPMPEVCVAGCGYGSFTIRLLVFRTSKQSDTSSYQDRNQNTIKKKKTIIFPSGTESDTRSLKEGSRFWTNNVKGIQNWSRPTSCQEMSLFLGYYRGFNPRCFDHQNELYEENRKIEWSGDMERDFKQLIAQFTSRKI